VVDELCRTSALGGKRTFAEADVKRAPENDRVTSEVVEDPADDDLREIAEDLDRQAWREADQKMGGE
jgi:hypothetical protein